MSKNKKALDAKELEEKLIQDNYGLVISQALRFFEDPNFDDYVQAGLIGLLKAIRKYDSSKSQFVKYAATCIKNSISSLQKKINNHGSKKVRVVIEQDKQYSTKERLKNLLPESISDDDRFILNCRIEGYTNSEIASFMMSNKNEIKSRIEIIIKTLQDHNK